MASRSAAGPRRGCWPPPRSTQDRLPQPPQRDSYRRPPPTSAAPAPPRNAADLLLKLRLKSWRGTLVVSSIRPCARLLRRCDTRLQAGRPPPQPRACWIRSTPSSIVRGGGRATSRGRQVSLSSAPGRRQPAGPRVSAARPGVVARLGGHPQLRLGGRIPHQLRQTKRSRSASLVFSQTSQTTSAAVQVRVSPLSRSRRTGNSRTSLALGDHLRKLMLCAFACSTSTAARRQVCSAAAQRAGAPRWRWALLGVVSGLWA